MKIEGKFTSITDIDDLKEDSLEKYDTLFQDLPDERSENAEGVVTTGREGQRRWWLLRRGFEEIAAVDHETGVEILIAFIEELSIIGSTCGHGQNGGRLAQATALPNGGRSSLNKARKENHNKSSATARA